MTAVLERPTAGAQSNTDDIKRCECPDKCAYPAAWLYTLKCCGRPLLVCEKHHDFHISAPPAKHWRCTRCKISRSLSDMVVSMVRI